MDFVFLAQTTNFILKPFAWILSKIIDVLFQLTSSFTVSHSLGITIILFTVIIRSLLMPLTLKQQRSSRKMQRIQPQIQKIQDKYKDKTDPESKQKMSMEMQEIYTKNKTSPFSGCLPMLIQMPILFAMYEILRNLPFYITDIGGIFETMAEQVMAIEGYESIITETFAEATRGLTKFDVTKLDSVIDFLSHLSRTQWNEFMEITGLAADAAFYEGYQLQNSINAFLSFNLSEIPGWGWPGIIWPVLAGATTWLQSWLMQRANDKRNRINKTKADDKQQSTMKTMNIVFPFMMAFFVVTMPLGLGVYWIAGNIFSIIQQYFLDMIIDKEEREDAIRRRDEFEEKKRMKELSRSNIDSRTGKRIGTADQQAVNKSSMAGNKIAAVKKQQEMAKKTSETSEKEIENTEE